MSLTECIIDELLITLEMAAKKLHNLNPTKSPGGDGRHPRLLKEAKNELIHPLCIIYNNSLNSESLPTQWKVENVTAIYTKGKNHPQEIIDL